MARVWIWLSVRGNVFMVFGGGRLGGGGGVGKLEKAGGGVSGAVGVVGGGGAGMAGRWGRAGEDFFCIGAARKPRVSFSFWRVAADRSRT